MGWVVSAKPLPLYPHERYPVPIIWAAGWTPGPFWTGAENLVLTGISFLYYLVLYLYLIRTSFFVLIFLHFAFCPYSQQTTQISMPPAGFDPATPASDRPQNLAFDRSANRIGRDSIPRDRPTRSKLLYRLSYRGQRNVYTELNKEAGRQIVGNCCNLPTASNTFR